MCLVFVQELTVKIGQNRPSIANWNNRDRRDDNNPPRQRMNIVIDDDPCNDLDSFFAFSNRLLAIQWPATFKPVGFEKFDSESDPKTWLRTYSIAVHAANGNNDNWLEALLAGSVNSWQDLCTTFVQYYQVVCPGLKTRWDLASVI